jgi:hypothetical protein
MVTSIYRRGGKRSFRRKKVGENNDRKKEVGKNLSSREGEVTVAEVESGHKKLTHARSLLLD